MRTTTRYLVAATFAALAMIAPVGMAGAGVDAAAHQLTFSPDPPVPFEPLTVTVDIDDCPPGGDATATLFLVQFVTDIVWYEPIDTAWVTADGDGTAAVHLEAPIAYPGSWEVVSACDGPYHWASFEIDAPDDFEMITTATSVRLGEPFSFELSGTACPGTHVEWEMALHPITYFARGSVIPDGDGNWSVTVEGTAPTDYDWDSIGLGAACVFENGIRVGYPYFSIDVLPANVTPPTPPTPATPRVVEPRFTG